ncbi:MAG: transposon-encoded TnpW family protein [Lachnospiraceae bacterium]|nr:transposon-encoded TnpW family protein [Lachnospiraceae bacterium]
MGNTTYDVSFHYSRQNRESMNDKIIRLIENVWKETLPHILFPFCSRKVHEQA